MAVGPLVCAGFAAVGVPITQAQGAALAAGGRKGSASGAIDLTSRAIEMAWGALREHARMSNATRFYSGSFEEVRYDHW
jgi:hypothetical protein